MDKKPKVVFTFVEAGLGHIIPMTGMCEEFTKKYGDKCEIVKSYFFRDSKYKKVNELGLTLSDHTKKTMSNVLYNKLEAISYMFSSKLTLWFLDKVFGKKKQYCYDDLKNLNPDLIVSSYYLPSHLAYKTNKKGITNTLIATYTPDTYIYPAWDRNCDIYFTATDWAYKDALKKGFNKNQVKFIPFIFKQSITEFNKTKQQCRDELEIDDRFTVLMTSGAYGAKLENTVKLVKKLFDSGKKLNIIVICGKSEKLFELLHDCKSNDNCSLTVLKMTDKMAEYMRASDVVVGKASTNTVFECYYLNTPMILNAVANRLEEHMIKYAVKNNLGLKIFNVDKITKTILKIIDGESVFPQRLDIPCLSAGGAEKAADMLFDLLATKFPQLKEN